MGISNYAVAKALMEQHGFTFDVAYLSVWYSIYPERTPPDSLHQLLARIEQCKRVPQISEQFAQAMFSAYQRRVYNEKLDLVR